jgi:hypothetical protein
VAQDRERWSRVTPTLTQEAVAFAALYSVENIQTLAPQTYARIDNLPRQPRRKFKPRGSRRHKALQRAIRRRAILILNANVKAWTSDRKLFWE